MPVGTLSADVGLHLGRPASVRSCNVLLLLGFGLYLGVFFLLPPFRTSLEGDAALNNGINIVSSVSHIIDY